MLTSPGSAVLGRRRCHTGETSSEREALSPEGPAHLVSARIAVLSVRPACLDDLPFICKLVPRLADPSFSPAYYRTEQLVSGTIRALRSALERSSDDELLVIAYDDSREFGFLWADTKRDYFTAEAHGYIEEVAVAGDAQGTGTRLLEFAEDWSRERGHRYISLSVRPGNQRAKALYERRGYGLDVEVRLKLL